MSGLPTVGKCMCLVLVEWSVLDIGGYSGINDSNVRVVLHHLLPLLTRMSLYPLPARVSMTVVNPHDQTVCNSTCTLRP